MPEGSSFRKNIFIINHNLNPNKYKLIVFDLDGTLVDSAGTIYDSTIAALSELGIKHNLTREILDKRIGAHFQDIFDELNIVVDDFEGFIEVYKGYYFDYISSSYLYPGVAATLSYLKNNHYRIALLTTKAQDQADKIILHFGLEHYFDYVMGRREGIPVKPSPEPLLIICNETRTAVSESLMVGDTELDIQCGAAANVPTCAVTYGYRSVKELIANNPSYIISKPEELIYKVLTNHKAH